MRRVLSSLLIAGPIIGGCVALSELDTLKVDDPEDGGIDATTSALKDGSVAPNDGSTPSPSDAGVDSTSTGAALGESCANDVASCQESLFCSSPFLAPTACTSACTSSTDCPSGFVCIASGRGGAFCMRGNAVGRDTLGSAAAGTACDAGPTCRSGLCLGNKCIDNCGQDSDCAAGSRCRAGQINGHYSFVCAFSPGKAEVNAPCDAGDQCASAACVGGACARPCCAAKDCQGIAQKGCGHFVYDGDRIPICTIAGDKPTGETCDKGNQCASGHCDPVTLKCAVVCCVDSDCAANEVCRPGPGEPYSLHCLPK